MWVSAMHEQSQVSNLERFINRKPVSVLAVCSGKGGVGKTNVAVNIAVALGARQHRVCLLDADVSLANVDVLRDQLNGAPGRPMIESIAVLPLEDISGDPDNVTGHRNQGEDQPDFEKGDCQLSLWGHLNLLVLRSRLSNYFLVL